MDWLTVYVTAIELQGYFPSHGEIAVDISLSRLLIEGAKAEESTDASTFSTLN